MLPAPVRAIRGSLTRAAIACLLTIALCACQTESGVRPRILHHEVENGAAALTYAASLNQKFVFSADLSLPPRPDNLSWYALWLMVGERKSPGDLPAMLRVGLIRWEQSQFQAQAFYATEHGSHQLDLTAVPGTVDDFHKFAITSDSSTIQLKMDDKVLLSAKVADFFDSRTPIYLKIAAEVYADGDRPSGTVRNIHMDSADAQDQVPAAEAAFDDRGLHFACIGLGQWEAEGKFDPSLPVVKFVPPLCH